LTGDVDFHTPLSNQGGRFRRHFLSQGRLDEAAKKKSNKDDSWKWHEKKAGEEAVDQVGNDKLHGILFSGNHGGAAPVENRGTLSATVVKAAMSGKND